MNVQIPIQARAFRDEMRREFEIYLEEARGGFSESDSLFLDTHCHDRNSDVPDELWGRILKLPETWLKPKELYKTLRSNGSTAFCITNHNNARSAWELLDKGFDILPAAEFTCYFPEYDTWIHILVYGFNPAQEEVLKRTRRNVYDFIRQCREWDLPVIQPHPLYFYAKDQQPPIEFFEKCAILFERFEVLNGQRELWQNLLTWQWVQSFDEEKIRGWELKHNLNARDFCARPYDKRICGGSDDHFGVFAGLSGTRLHIPQLQERLALGAKSSELALEALRDGQMRPYGQPADEERLTAAFLDYFAEATIRAQDPGLLRIFLHQGEWQDKLACLTITNILSELRRHKVTTRFLEAWHEALQGEKPGWLMKLAAPKEYSSILESLSTIARVRRKDPKNLGQTLSEVFAHMSDRAHHLVLDRATEQLSPMLEKRAAQQPEGSRLNFDEWVSHLEVPSHFRALFGKEKPAKSKIGMSDLNLGKVLDSLRFPALVGGVLLSATLASSHSLFASRKMMNELAQSFGGLKHAERILWLTDTLEDANGVSSALQEVLREVRVHNLPIDFLVVSDSLESGDHLLVLPPVGKFRIPGMGEQEFRFPDLLQVHRAFLQGGYDRILCSTELLMGPVALFLKHAFQVPAHFFLHTDWLTFLEHNTALSADGISRVRRMLRWFYQQFDGLFVLNKEQGQWLRSSSMGIAPSKIFQTAHWVAPEFHAHRKTRILWNDLPKGTKTILFAGRLSEEKGTSDLIKAWHLIQAQNPNIHLIIAGKGPAEDELRRQLPEARFLGWLDRESLAKVYSSADLLFFPSRFDTFGCALLEAMSCGLPVLAYPSKGPMDLIEHGRSGYLCQDYGEMAEVALDLLKHPEIIRKLRQGALDRASQYTAPRILNQILKDLDILNIHLNED